MFSVLGLLIVVGYIGMGRQLLISLMMGEFFTVIVSMGLIVIVVVSRVAFGVILAIRVMFIDQIMFRLYLMMHIVVVRFMMLQLQLLRQWVVMHSMSMVQLGIEMSFALVADQLVMLSIVMLVASQVLAIANIVELRPVVCIMVIWVGVLDVCLVVVNCFIMVRMLVEVDRVVLVDVVMSINHDITTMKMHLVLSILLFMRQKVLLRLRHW